MPWGSTGLQTNPVAGTLVQLTSSIGGRVTHGSFALAATVNVTFALERLLADGVTVIDSMNLGIFANSSFAMEFEFVANQGDIVRLRLVNGITGSLVGALCLQAQ